MDSKGRNVIVCDNGTGVSIRAAVKIRVGRLLITILCSANFSFIILVRQMRLCWEQFSSLYFPVNGWKTHH